MILKEGKVNYSGIFLPLGSKFLYTNYVDMQNSLDRKNINHSKTVRRKLQAINASGTVAPRPSVRFFTDREP